MLGTSDPNIFPQKAVWWWFTMVQSVKKITWKKQIQARHCEVVFFCLVFGMSNFPAFFDVNPPVAGRIFLIPTYLCKNPRLPWTPFFWRYFSGPQKTYLKSTGPVQDFFHQRYDWETRVLTLVFQANTCPGRSSFGSLFFGGVQSYRTKRQGVQWEA